jgi:hypothetical protein
VHWELELELELKCWQRIADSRSLANVIIGSRAIPSAVTNSGGSAGGYDNFKETRANLQLWRGEENT